MKKVRFSLTFIAPMMLLGGMFLFNSCQKDSVVAEEEFLLKAAVPYELACDYPDEAYNGEEFEISFSSTCGKIMMEKGYIDGDPIYENEVLVGYEKIYVGLTCETENLKWESISGDEMVSCSGGTVAQTLEEVGTYVYRAKVSSKAFKNSDCPDCLTFKGVRFKCFLVTVVEGNKGTFTDSRDGHVYKWVKIGDQKWMAENLAYKTETGSWAYNDDESNVKVYGRLYDWPTAMVACPDGWHLPSEMDWTALTTFLGGESIAGAKMKVTGTMEAGTGWWLSPNEGATNESGFSALPGGCRMNGYAYYDIGTHGYWWSSSEFSPDIHYFRVLSNGSTYIQRSGHLEGTGFTVRCIKN